MKIRDIRVHFVNALWRNFVIVRVETDDGLVGYGEGTMGDFEKTVKAAVMDFRPHLLGRDVDVASISTFLYEGFFWRGGPILMSAISAIEQALWDITAKAVNKPISHLLGGTVVDRIRVYANGFISGSATPKEYGAAASKQVEAGFNALKFDPFGGAGPTISARDLGLAVERVKAVRDAVGPDIDILVEAEGRFDPATAIRAAGAVQKFGPMWFEEPIPEQDLSAMAYVRARSPVPVATGERIVTRHRYAELFEKGAADIVQPDVCHVGGISALCEIGSMARTHYIPVAPHNPNGPVATAATMNAMATMSNSLILEFWLDVESVRRDLVERYFDVKDGYVRPSGLPGLGIEINEKALDKYPYRKLHLDYYSDGYRYHGDADSPGRRPRVRR